LEGLAKGCVDFAIETTLAGKTLAARVSRLRAIGYHSRVIYLWIPDVELSISRVASRVKKGGHDIPEDTIRRRYDSGRRNFFEIYRPIADEWAVYDSTSMDGPELIAKGTMQVVTKVVNEVLWQQVQGD
jgi:predicted ABC-type ATPase